LNLDSRSKFVKQLANRHGFKHIGISKAERLDEEAILLEKWLNQNMHGEMSYMENHFDMRVDPTKLVPGAKSVISLLINYATDEVQADPNAPKISKYAFGRDYHKIIRKQLKHFLHDLRAEFGQVEGRGFVDSAPVLERAWAKRAGIGWIGKHSLILNKDEGSWFFIAVLITDLELNPDSQVQDHCGTCTKCMDACPTDAIEQPYVVNGSKCISYFTIELKNAIPEEFQGKMENWMFGCDICQDVCPWNRFSKKHQQTAFQPKPELLEFTKQDWQELTHEIFDEIFEGSAVKRTGFDGLKRNIKFLED